MRKLPIGFFVIATAAALLSVSGCAFAGRHYPSFPWVKFDQRQTMEDDESDPREGLKRKARRAWDAGDASFQEGNCGVYVGGGSTVQHYPVALGSMGVFKLPTSWSTVRGGVFGMDKDGIGFGGAEAGVRVHAPTRLTPYLGLSGDLGISGLASGYARRQTNPGHPTQKTTTLSGVAAIVPEAGVSCWLNSSTRLSAGASYYFTASQPDFLLFGVSLEFVTGDDFCFGSFANPTKSSTPQRMSGNSTGGDGADVEKSDSYFVQSADSTDLLETGHSSVDQSAISEIPAPVEQFDFNVEVLH